MQPRASESRRESLAKALLRDFARGLSGEFAINWQPQPKQEAAIESEADELLYGGQAGGGKTDVLLGLALTRHRRSVIFRRQYTSMRDLVDRSLEIVGEPKYLNRSEMRWRLPDGRVVDFGAVEHEDDKHKWQGRAHDLKAFDEVTQFTESQYLFLTGWNRTTARGQRCRIVATANPPETDNGVWVFDRWAAWLDPNHPKPARPGELRWYVRIDGKDTEVQGPEPVEHRGERLVPRSRTFIPAALADNSYLAGTGYEAVIDQMPEPLRSQLKFGDWTVGMRDSAWQVIPSEWVAAAMKRWKEAPRATRHLDAIGIDVARGGDADTVLAKRHGNWVAPLISQPGSETRRGSDIVRLIAQHWTDGAEINIDVAGVGSSPHDLLEAAGYPVHGINAAAGTDERDRSGRMGFRNVRALMWWRLREALDPELGEGLALPPDPQLRRELTAVRWKLSLSGVQIESKDDVVKRIGRSTDAADAVALACLLPPRLEVGGEDLHDDFWRRGAG